MTLPALAADRRRACSTALAARPQLSIAISSRRTLSSKPAGRHCCCRSMGQTDRRTDEHLIVTKTLAYYVGNVGKRTKTRLIVYRQQNV